VSNTTGDKDAHNFPATTRRERLERIASAERDRRAGHPALAIASIGEPVEWPARAVIALARLSQVETARVETAQTEIARVESEVGPTRRAHDEARRVLEEGLDLWAREAGLESLDGAALAVEEASEVEAETEAADEFEIEEADPLGLIADLAATRFEIEVPFDAAELERAFDSAEADVESMRNVNEVAARVLMYEAVGLGADSGAPLTPVEVEEQRSAYDVAPLPDTLGMDAASAIEVTTPSVCDADTGQQSESESNPQEEVVLATLESWLRNIERRKERGAS
jgi:hypothetical protein